MKNFELSKNVYQQLAKLGVKELCICPGGRNAPLVHPLETHHSCFEYHSYFDERAASFFALGRIKYLGNPVAVITTSGTAVSEVFSAVIEAHYTGLPLIIVTADRPRRYRGTGAPQSIEQKNIFGTYVSHYYELTADEEIPQFILNQGPIHINICYDEPLIDGEMDFDFEPSKHINKIKKRESPVLLEKFLQNKKNTLVIVSHLDLDSRDSVSKFLSQAQMPVFAEASSGLKKEACLEKYLIKSGDAFLKKTHWDSVLRIGGIPTSRFWRDLEFELAHLPLFSVSETPFSGATHGTFIHSNLDSFFKSVHVDPIWDNSSLQKCMEEDFQQYCKLQDLADSEPSSEPSLIRQLSRLMHEEDRVFIGNSMPIRQWDLLTTHPSKHFGSNRGANGIDGQLSCFIGFTGKHTRNWGIFGDLTTLYDLSAPWILNKIDSRDIQFVIINNQGGKIFSRMFQKRIFLNEHQINFKPWAELWGLDYYLWKHSTEEYSPKRSSVIELHPDQEATHRFWLGYQKLWST